jgi:hypothetical protein
MPALSVVRDNIGDLADRHIVDTAFLFAATETIRDIESRDYRLVKTVGLDPILCDGSSEYLLPLEATPLTLMEVWVRDAHGQARKLVEKTTIVTPDQPYAPLRTYYYELRADGFIVLGTFPAAPTEILLFVRAYQEPYDLATVIDYQPLAMGILTFLGENVWEDRMAAGWRTSYERSIKQLIDRYNLRDADLGNLLDRMPSRSSFGSIDDRTIR